MLYKGNPSRALPLLRNPRYQRKIPRGWLPPFSNAIRERERRESPGRRAWPRRRSSPSMLVHAWSVCVFTQHSRRMDNRIVGRVHSTSAFVYHFRGYTCVFHTRAFNMHPGVYCTQRQLVHVPVAPSSSFIAHRCSN